MSSEPPGERTVAYTSETGSGTADTLATPVAPAGRIGPYRLLELIGEGGMGTVYRVEQEHPVRRLAALKVIKPGLDSARIIARFEAERQALALMDHPGVARVLDAGTTPEGRPYFVMELVEGVPITLYCDQHRLPLRARLELFVSVCLAIQHAHSKGVIHRDIKPSNILVADIDGRPTPRVIDFGVAKAITPGTEGEAGLTEVGAVIGTPEYMSPEQAEPFAADIDTRADVYSLGVLLYELLTGETPLGRETIRQVPLNEVLRRVREEEPPRPSARLTTASGPAPPAASQRQADPARLARQLRGDLDWIVMKALDKDRERRYPTANGLAQDVMRYLNDEPIVARPPSALYRLRKFTRKHQVGVVSFVLCLVLLVGGLLASAWQAVRASRAETEALAQRDAAQAARLQAEQAEQRAGREAAIAREIAEFLRHDLLGQADPHKQPDRDLKLRAVLDRASRQIPGRFRDPLVEAAVRDTIGNAYLALGEHAQAEPHLRRALELRRQHLGAAEPDTLQSHNSWGELLRKSGRLTQAEETFRAGLRLAHEHWGADHDLTLTLANNLGVTLVARGRFEEAETILKDTLERRLRVLGERARHTLASMNNLAELLLERGRVDEAEKLQVRAVASAVQAFGEDAPETLALNNLLAMIYDRQGKHDLSEPLFTTVLEKRRRVLGEEHPETLGSMSNLALWHLERSRHDRAEPLFRAALAISTRKLPADHPDLLTLKNNLALALDKQDKDEEAEKLYRETLEARDRVLKPDHPHTLGTRSNLAEFYRKRGRYDEAEAMLEEVVQTLTQRLGATHRDTMTAMNNLALAYQSRRKLEDAERLFARLLAARRQALGDDHEHTIVSLAALAEIRRDRGQVRQALPLFEEALEKASRHRGLGEEHDLTLTICNNLALAYQTLKRLPEAEKLLARTLEIRRRRLGDEHEHTLATTNNLALLYLDQGKFSAAEPLLDRALPICRKKFGNDHPSTQLILGNLSLAAFLQKKYARAEALLVEAVAHDRERHQGKNPDFVNKLAILGTCRVELKKYAEAEPVLRECLALRQKAIPEHWTTFNATSLLGAALLGQKKYAEAEPLLVSGYEGMKAREKQIPPQGKLRLQEAGNRLLELYTAWNKPDKLTQWRERFAREKP